MLSVVGLSAAAEKYPWQLSGGMKMRVSLARALRALVLGRALEGREALRVHGLDAGDQAVDLGAAGHFDADVSHAMSEGEIEVRGPWVTGSYHNDPAPEKFRDGWLRTGDVGTLDERGFFTITDRIKDVIKSGGEWISSVDLENELMAHPAVQEAAVIAEISALADRGVAEVVLTGVDLTSYRPSLAALVTIILRELPALRIRRVAQHHGNCAGGVGVVEDPGAGTLCLRPRLNEVDRLLA